MKEFVRRIGVIAVLAIVSMTGCKDNKSTAVDKTGKNDNNVAREGGVTLLITDADLIEVLNLDAKGKSIREQIDEDLITETKENIRKAGAAIRENSFQRLTKWCDTCSKCDFKGICRKP